MKLFPTRRLKIIDFSFHYVFQRTSGWILSRLQLTSILTRETITTETRQCTTFSGMFHVVSICIFNTANWNLWICFHSQEATTSSFIVRPHYFHRIVGFSKFQKFLLLPLEFSRIFNSTTIPSRHNFKSFPVQLETHHFLLFQCLACTWNSEVENSLQKLNKNFPSVKFLNSC